MAFANYRGFASINKVEDQPDGTIKVYGIASSGARDSAGEIVHPDAMKAALPDYSKFPALREMHQPLAAGRTLDAYVDEDGVTQIEAHVVDPIAVTKVKTGVYAGFSIGGKVLKRDPDDRTIITGLRLAEISLVDAPCNPEATLNMWKADMSDYNPSGDEVVAKAKEMAKAAGRKAFKDYLYHAREELIAIHKADAADQDDETDEELEEAGDVAEGLDQALNGEGEEAGKAAQSEPLTDPAAALTEALAKANQIVAPTEPAAEAEPVHDLHKSAAALRMIVAKAEGDLLHKGLYTVARLAQVIDSVADVQQSVTYEAQYEQDNSPVPAALAANVAALCATLVQMVNEETAEILAAYSAQGIDLDFDAGGLSEGDDDDVFQYAASIVDLVKADTHLMEKAGSRHNKTDAALVQEVHDKAVALGAHCNESELQHQGAEEDHGKALLVAENDRLAKALADAAPKVEELAKAFNDKITGLTDELSDMRKRLDQVESEPAAPKTGVLRTVTKGQDISPGNVESPAEGTQLTAEEFQKALDALPERERGEVLVKIALGRPYRINP